MFSSYFFSLITNTLLHPPPGPHPCDFCHHDQTPLSAVPQQQASKPQQARTDHSLPLFPVLILALPATKPGLVTTETSANNGCTCVLATPEQRGTGEVNLSIFPPQGTWPNYRLICPCIKKQANKQQLQKKPKKSKLRYPQSLASFLSLHYEFIIHNLPILFSFLACLKSDRCILYNCSLFLLCLAVS